MTAFGHPCHRHFYHSAVPSQSMDKYFDKDVIRRGDRLYDVIDGVVEVVDVREDSFMCAKNGASTSSAPTIVQYTFDGVKARARVRTLYWHNPVVAIPRKDAGLWASQMQLIGSLVERFSDFVSSAAIKSHDTYNPVVSSANAALERGLLTGTECRELLLWIRERAFADYEEHNNYEPESVLDNTEQVEDLGR